MKRKFFRTALCAFAVGSALALSALAYTDAQLSAAKNLYDLGLLKGNDTAFSAESMDLDSYATRAQLAVTVTRMLGKENKAIYQQNAHPFTDVPSWASAHVGYLYENYLVNGVSDTWFAADDVATTNQFCAMLLRVLGYSEAEWDFAYEDATNFAINLGLTDESASWTYELTRGRMIEMCHTALGLQKKLSEHTLADRLIDEKVISAAVYAEGGGDYSASGVGLEAYFSSVDTTVWDASASWEGDVIYLSFSPLEEYGVRVFYTCDEKPTPTELERNGSTIGFQKGPIDYSGGGAGYIRYLTLYGLENMHNLQVIVVKTSGEGDSYLTLGKSDIIRIEENDGKGASGLALALPYATVDNTIGEVRSKRKGDDIYLWFDPLEEYGVRVFYTSKDDPTPTELPENGYKIGFEKGEIDYSGGGAGYIDQLVLYGLGDKRDLKLIVLKTSSEGSIYLTLGKSDILELN